MITGIPPYSNATPVEYSVRCLCGARYLVFNPDAHSLGDAEGRSKERASQMHAQFVNFEGHQTRPICLSPDGTRLFAVNTPDARLSVFGLATSAVAGLGRRSRSLPRSSVWSAAPKGDGSTYR